MNDWGYLTRLLPMKSKKSEHGYFMSWKQGVYKDAPYQKLMIHSVYKSNEGKDAGVLKGNYKKGNNRLDNIYIRPELVSDVVEGVCKIFEEQYGINLIGHGGVKTPQPVQPPVRDIKTKDPLPEKETSLEDRLKGIGLRKDGRG